MVWEQGEMEGRAEKVTIRLEQAIAEIASRDSRSPAQHTPHRHISGFCFVFEAGSLYVVPAVLELAM